MKINSDNFYYWYFVDAELSTRQYIYRRVWYDEWMANRKGYNFVVLVLISWYQVEENQW